MVIVSASQPNRLVNYFPPYRIDADLDVRMVSLSDLLLAWT
jgi:hypothetical protein